MPSFFVLFYGPSQVNGNSGVSQAVKYHSSGITIDPTVINDLSISHELVPIREPPWPGLSPARINAAACIVYTLTVPNCLYLSRDCCPSLLAPDKCITLRNQCPGDKGGKGPYYRSWWRTLPSVLFNGLIQEKSRLFVGIKDKVPRLRDQLPLLLPPSTVKWCSRKRGFVTDITFSWYVLIKKARI